MRASIVVATPSPPAPPSMSAATTPLNELHPLATPTAEYVVTSILLGESGVGKTTLRAALCKEVPVTKHATTIGADYGSTLVPWHGTNIRLQLWDTAGQERYAAIVGNTYFRRAHLVWLVYDCSNAASAERLVQWWWPMARDSVPDATNLVVAVVGNKVDSVSVSASASASAPTGDPCQPFIRALMADLHSAGVPHSHHVRVSARTGQGMASLAHDVVSLCGLDRDPKTGMPKRMRSFLAGSPAASVVGGRHLHDYSRREGRAAGSGACCWGG